MLVVLVSWMDAGRIGQLDGYPAGRIGQLDDQTTWNLVVDLML